MKKFLLLVSSILAFSLASTAYAEGDETGGGVKCPTCMIAPMSFPTAVPNGGPNGDPEGDGDETGGGKMQYRGSDAGAPAGTFNPAYSLWYWFKLVQFTL